MTVGDDKPVAQERVEPQGPEVGKAPRVGVPAVSVLASRPGPLAPGAVVVGEEAPMKPRHKSSLPDERDRESRKIPVRPGADWLGTDCRLWRSAWGVLVADLADRRDRQDRAGEGDRGT